MSINCFVGKRKLKCSCVSPLITSPTFIKLGQLLSTRVDVLPTEYVTELKVLQDKVPGFDGKKAVEIVETELGSSIENLFDAFDETPIAAASLGQVHLAVLKGEQVAVKVRSAQRASIVFYLLAPVCSARLIPFLLCLVVCGIRRYNDKA
uniref:ABC1 atypical kinase-like domain-containing protein n=1 Tax=Rhodosorus marinus TaxID=101924 RepID=A0A7S3EG61_9RHOD|mmetsp:Transcript_31515/g.122001  ORF Transcript_31515/g.122001 Transcript_31515/m.122001 type:complete len:150 (+) Transcript_31515:1262-1711(+)